jgi:hypothetical protein
MSNKEDKMWARTACVPQLPPARPGMPMVREWQAAKSDDQAVSYKWKSALYDSVLEHSYERMQSELEV